MIIIQCAVCGKDMEVEEQYKNASVSHGGCAYDDIKETRDKMGQR